MKSLENFGKPTLISSKVAGLRCLETSNFCLSKCAMECKTSPDQGIPIISYMNMPYPGHVILSRVELSKVWAGWAWTDMTRPGQAQPSPAWQGLMWYHEAHPCLARPRQAWPGLTWSGLTRALLSLAWIGQACTGAGSPGPAKFEKNIVATSRPGPPN